mmetsp:Transcript_53962/g.81809  ORF Transcript_53962/g.81809 Transcript_53962/m.81809 type:complete len:80 (+) Transcript_53962:145-384(+)
MLLEHPSIDINFNSGKKYLKKICCRQFHVSHLQIIPVIGAQICKILQVHPADLLDESIEKEKELITKILENARQKSARK